MRQRRRWWSRRAASTRPDARGTCSVSREEDRRLAHASAFGGASLEAASPRTPGEVPEARGVVELLAGCDEGHGVPSEARSEARDDLRTRARAR